MTNKIFKIDQTDYKIRTLKDIKEALNTLNDYRCIIMEENACDLVAFNDKEDLDGDYTNYIGVDHNDLSISSGSLYLGLVQYDFEDELEELSEEKTTELETLLEEKLGCWIDCERAEIEINVSAINTIVSEFIL